MPNEILSEQLILQSFNFALRHRTPEMYSNCIGHFTWKNKLIQRFLFVNKITDKMQERNYRISHKTSNAILYSYKV